jgi:hypothetical protein
MQRGDVQISGICHTYGKGEGGHTLKVSRAPLRGLSKGEMSHRSRAVSAPYPFATAAPSSMCHAATQASPPTVGGTERGVNSVAEISPSLWGTVDDTSGRVALAVALAATELTPNVLHTRCPGADGVRGIWAKLIP